MMTDNPTRISAVFVIPLGPRDLARVGWTIQSIRRHCKNFHIMLLLDGPRTSDLPEGISGVDLSIREATPPSLGHWGKIWLMQCRAMVDALTLHGLDDDAVFIKIDADALIVRHGLIERAQRIFATRPAAGQIGQCFSSVLGGRLANAGWANFFRKMSGWRGLVRLVQGALAEGEGFFSGVAAHREFRALLARAGKFGYTDGEFAIGGSYILRRAVVERLEPLLPSSPFRFLSATGEDGVMTPYVYATGHAAFDDVSDGGIYAVEGKEFRVDPFVLLERGHYILHPTKYGHAANGYQLSEAELVERIMGQSSENLSDIQGRT